MWDGRNAGPALRAGGPHQYREGGPPGQMAGLWLAKEGRAGEWGRVLRLRALMAGPGDPQASAPEPKAR